MDDDPDNGCVIALGTGLILAVLIAWVIYTAARQSFL
jgi:hypothetical protein